MTNTTLSSLSNLQLRQNPKRFENLLGICISDFDDLVKNITLYQNDIFNGIELADAVCITLLHKEQSMSQDLLAACFDAEQTVINEIIQSVEPHITAHFEVHKGEIATSLAINGLTEEEILRSLMDTEENFRSAVNALGEGIVLQGLNGQIVFCNPRAEEILGLSTDQMSGRTCLDPRWRAVHEDGTPFPGEGHPAMVTLRTGEPQRNVVMGIYKPNDTLTWLLVNSQPIRHNDSQEVSGVVVSFTDITEQKLTEEALQKSESQFRAIFDASPVPYAINDEQGNIIRLNPAFISTFGYDLSDIPTLHEWWPKAYPDALYRQQVAAQWKENLDKANSIGTPFQPMELKVQCKDSTQRIVLVSAAPLHKMFQGMRLVILHNITERKRFEDDLRKTRDFYVSLVGTVDVVLWESNPETHEVTFISEQAKDMLGYAPDEWMQYEMFWRDHLHPDDRERVFAYAEERIQNADKYDIEYRFLKPNGETVWLRDVVTVERAEGKPILLRGALVDITEQKEQEELLRQSEANLRSIMDSSVQAFWLTDTTLHVKAFNKLTAHTVRTLFERDIVLGDSILNYVQPEKHKSFLASAHRALAGEAVVYEEEFQSEHGETQWMELMYLPTYNTEGKIIGLTLSSFNVTERKIAYQALTQMNQVLEDRVLVRTRELVQLNNEKTEFLGIAAHDLKNPLAGILSSAEILECQFADEPSKKRLISMIISASDQMLDIITNLLDVNRIESGMVSINIQPVNMEILDSIVEEYQSRAAQKGIIIHYDNQRREPIWALADKQSLRQVFDNLLSNAVKYSPQWKPIWVRVLHRITADGHKVRLEVQDEGRGVSEEDKKMLFGKFARLSAQPTGGENSTGLGLSIVKKLVELQHGKVWCESTFGLGATFIVELPMAEISKTD
ncbi:MAG: PAS domain S-box protein [Ignavibacteria bacterium]|nr:PAS domain S-box protein [Ignavibacteria bacterium]